MRFLPILAAAGDLTGESASEPWVTLLIALGLLVAAFVLLILEFFIVSGGILGLGAVVLAVSGIVMAFQVHALVGWGLVVATPIAAVAVVRWGVRRLQETRVVAQGVSGGRASYEEVAGSRGISIGSEGVMLTDAFPGGRARFEGGVIDVVARGGSLEKGAPIRVAAIEGPTAFVTLAPQSPDTEAPERPST